VRRDPPLEFVTVYVGSHASVTALEGVLEAEGIPTFVPDRLMKSVDPFITGGHPLALSLQVPGPYEQDARALVASQSPAPLASRPTRRAWRWAALLLILPIVLILGFELLDRLAS
jgi:hypothetical protein